MEILATYCNGDSVLSLIFLNLFDINASYSLKSLLTIEILHLSLGLIEFSFFGLLRNIMRAVLIETVGGCPRNISIITLVKLFPMLSRHSLHKSPGILSVPDAALRFEERRHEWTSDLVGVVSSI